MRYLPLFALFWFAQIQLFAQPAGVFGNEWYTEDISRTFIPLKVTQEGLYRVSDAELMAAGYDLSMVNPDELKLIFRGNEQPIHVVQSGGILDFLEFPGKQNDGRVDSMMYRDPLTSLHAPDLQPNIDISLFTDTAVYFLTWSNGPGLRYETFIDTHYALYSPELSFPFEAKQTFHPNDSLTTYIFGGGSRYSIDYELNPDYGPGEGYIGPQFAYLQPFSLPIYTPDALIGSQDSIRFETRIFNQSPSQHQLKIEVNNAQAIDIQLSADIKVRTFSLNMLLPAVSDTTIVDFEAHYANQDINRICYAGIRYPRLTDMRGDSSLWFTGWESNSPAYFQFREAAGTDSVYVYDLENSIRIAGLIQQDTAHLILPGMAGKRNLYLASDLAIKQPLIASPQFANLSHTTQGAEYLILTHRDLAASAQAYATYRDTSQANGFSTKIVFMDEIYAEFSYGSISPWGIKRFLNYARENWTIPPQHVLLWGQGKYRTREYSGAMVPTFGYPNTDLEFVSPVSPDSLDISPRISIGRVNIQHDLEGDAYLDKVRAYEYAPWQDWMRRSIFLSMSKQAEEHQIFSQMLDSLAAGLESEYIPWSTYRFPDSFPDTPPVDLSAFETQLDSGATLLHLLGFKHQASGQLFLQAPYEYENWGKPPFIIGEFAHGEALSERETGGQWVLEPGRGAIGFFGNTAETYVSPLSVYNEELYETWRRDSSESGIGEIIRQTFMAHFESQSGSIVENIPRLMNLQGDPALRLTPDPFSFGDVWPGDANDDGVADMMDLLPIGLAFADTGYTRPDANLQWVAQPAPDWPQVFMDSVNYKHADTNGDSLINAADTLAIHLNYGLTHNKTADSNFTSSGVPVSLSYPAVGNAGDTIHIQVMLGDSLSPADSVYGVGFRVSYDINLVADSSVRVIFENSWMGNVGSDAMALYHDRSIDGEVDFAFTRTDHQPISGYGKIADISIVITDDLAKRAWDNWLEPDLAFGYAHDEQGIEIALEKRSNESFRPIVYGDAFVYPIPASDMLHVNPHGNQMRNLRLTDLHGRALFQLADTQGLIQSIDVADYAPGLYLLRYELARVSYVTKVLIQPE